MKKLLGILVLGELWSSKIFDKYDRELGYRYSREFEDGKAAFDRNAQLKSSN